MKHEFLLFHLILSASEQLLVGVSFLSIWGTHSHGYFRCSEQAVLLLFKSTIEEQTLILV